MSFGCAISVGSGSGTILCEVFDQMDFSNSSSTPVGYGGFTYGAGYTVRFTATPATGYTFSNFKIYLDSSHDVYTNGAYIQTFSSSPLSLTDSYVSDGQSYLVEANFTYTGTSGGGDSGSTTTYYYAYYNTSTGSYIVGPYSTTSSSISASTLSGYTYNGYVYHSSFNSCITQYTTGSGVDSTSYTCTSHSSSLPYVLFFYTPTTSSNYTYYYAGYDLTNGTYLYGPYNISSASSSISIQATTQTGYTYNGYVYHSSWSNCIGYVNNTGYDGTSTTGMATGSLPYLMFFYTPNSTSYTLNLTFDLNGGAWDGPTSAITLTSTTNSITYDASNLAHPIREGYCWQYWLDSTTNGIYRPVSPSTWIFSNLSSGTNNRTLTAQWIAKNPDESPKHIKIKNKTNSNHTRLKYIQFTGTQYINTNYYPNQRTTVSMDVTSKFISSDTWVPFGTTLAPSKLYFSIIKTSSNNNLTFWYGANDGDTYINSSLISYIGRRCQLTVDNNKTLSCKLKFCNRNYEISELEVHSPDTTLDFTCGEPLYFMSADDGSVISKGYIFSCQIYENNELIRNFLPVKKTDGTICFWDEVNDIYYLNAGTGEFVAGPEKVWHENLLAHVNTSNLIRDYKAIGAVAGFGSGAYIDTGFKPNNNTKVEIQFAAYNTTQIGVFGARAGYQSNAFSVWIGANGLGWRDDYYNITNYWDTSTQITGGNIFTVTKDKNKFYINGELKGSSSETTFQCDYNMFIGGINSGGSYATDYPFYGYIFYTKIWDNDILIRDYLPVKKKSTGEIGMYDRVNNKFYTSAGASSFSSAPLSAYSPGEIKKAWIKTPVLSLPTGYTALEYIVSHNHDNYIDTGFKPNQNTSILFISECDECYMNMFFGTDKFYSYTETGRPNFSWGETIHAYSGDNETRTNFASRNEIQFLAENRDFSIYGKTRLLTYSSFDAKTFESNSNLYLFKYNGDMTYYDSFFGKFYRCKIWDNGTLVKDYIPVKTSNNIGLYDLVNDSFVSGDFEAGPERSQWRLIK